MRADTDGEGDVLQITRSSTTRRTTGTCVPSPDGKQIAFDSDRDGTRGVYVADADGQRVRRVSGEGYAAVPSWSPDGARWRSYEKSNCRQDRTERLEPVDPESLQR